MTVGSSLTVTFIVIGIIYILVGAGIFITEVVKYKHDTVKEIREGPRRRLTAS